MWAPCKPTARGGPEGHGGRHPWTTTLDSCPTRLCPKLSLGSTVCAAQTVDLEASSGINQISFPRASRRTPGTRAGVSPGRDSERHPSVSF